MQKLSNAVDKLGAPIEIWISPTIQHTPCVPLILQVYAELVEKKWVPFVIPFRPTQQLVWIQDINGKVLAGIVYEYQSDFLNGYLVLSFTDPDHRGRGLNEICHRCYEADCKKLGAVTLSSFVHVDNTARIKSAEKAGMLPKFYKMHKDI
jgi:RimJ/RimL family protein N-acetyltransferase